MPDPRAAARRDRADALVGGAARAVSGVPGLRFRAGLPYRGGTELRPGAAHCYPAPDAELGDRRGAGDAVALRLRHGDDLLHRRLAPSHPVARLVYDAAEQARVESLADPAYAGVRRNLRTRVDTWAAGVEGSGACETADGLLLYGVIRLVRRRVLAEELDPRTEDLLEHLRFEIAPHVGGHLRALRRLRDDQAAYAAVARGLAETVARLHDAAVADSGTEPTGGRGAGARLVAPEASVEQDDDGETETGSGPARGARSGADGYRVFTREHDRESRAPELVRPEVLAQHRSTLDTWLAEDRVPTATLAARLRAAFPGVRPAGWSGAREEGLLDPRRLTALVTATDDRAVFRRRRAEPDATGALVLLLDCSGSMRRHRRAVAVAADAVARTCRTVGLPCEVLAFTTVSWRGGEPAREWERAGRPARPGRLAELQHVVLVAADRPWPRERPGLGMLLAEHLYREGVDGEAVLWAADRLHRLAGDRPGRRALVTVSDGSPMETATSLVEGGDHLGDHLRETVAAVERSGVSVAGLGFGTDLSPYYDRRLVLGEADPDARSVARAVVDLAVRDG